MADSKDIFASREEGTHYEKAGSQGRRRSTVADLNRNKNLDAK